MAIWHKKLLCHLHIIIIIKWFLSKTNGTIEHFCLYYIDLHAEMNSEKSDQN